MNLTQKGRTIVNAVREVINLRRLVDVYRVESTTNRLDPKPGTMLSDAEAEKLLQEVRSPSPRRSLTVNVK